MANSIPTRFQDLQNGAALALAYIAIASFLLAGVLFLYEGLGLDFRVLDYPSLKPYEIPIGLLLLGLGLATAKLWTFD